MKKNRGVFVVAAALAAAASGPVHAGSQTFLGIGATNMAAERGNWQSFTIAQTRHSNNFDLAAGEDRFFGADSTIQSGLPGSLGTLWNVAYGGVSLNQASTNAKGQNLITTFSSDTAGRDLFLIDSARGTPTDFVTSNQTYFLGLAGSGSSMRINLAPGQSAFGFDFFDVEGSRIRVDWIDSAGLAKVDDFTITIPGGTPTGGNNAKGFFGFIGEVGSQITSITLVMTPRNEGIAFDNFSYAAVIPLPGAVGLAGVGMLALAAAGRRRSVGL